jgi:protein-L-isoaspartate(D-aspartate) O-methyltransferase
MQTIGPPVLQPLIAMPSPQPTPHEKMMFQLNLRQRGISDQAVLKAMEDVPRELFVTSAERAYAYRDTALGIACGQTISQPFVVAYMTEQLDLHPEHRVLEVGTGSGYQAAILSKLAREVVSLERFRTLADRARLVLAELGCSNVDVVLGDGFDVPETLGTFDRIMVTAAMEEIPDALLARLEPGGVLIAPVGPMDDTQMLTRVVRNGDAFDRQELMAVRFVPALQGVAREL